MLNIFRGGRLRNVPNQPGSSHLALRTAPHVTASLHSEGVVLIHLGRGTVFSANRVGALIWNAVADRWSLDRVVETISSEFHIPAQAAREDAAEFLAQLAAEGLLVPAAG